MKKILLMLVLTALATATWAQSQLTTVRGKTKEGKTIKVEYYKGNVEDYVESVKYQLVDELNAKVQDLQSKLDVANKRLEALEKPLGSSGNNNTEIKRLNNEINELSKALDKLQEQLVNSELSNDSLIAVNADLQDRMTNVGNSGDKELQRLRDSIVSKDANIRKLNKTVADCEKQVRRLENDLANCGSRPVGYPKPSPVIAVQLGVGPAFAKEVEENWARDVNWMKKAEVYFGTARLSHSLMLALEAGVGIRSLKLSASRAPGELVENGIDANGDSFQAMYTFGAMQESQSLTYLDIPVRVCFGEPAKGQTGLYVKLGVTPSIKIADQFQGSGKYTLKGYYPQWDVTLENIVELGFGSDLEYYTADKQPVANGFVLWGNAMLGGYLPLSGKLLLNAGLGVDIPFMALTHTNAGSQAVIPSFEIGMVYSLK